MELVGVLVMEVRRQRRAFMPFSPPLCGHGSCQRPAYIHPLRARSSIQHQPDLRFVAEKFEDDAVVAGLSLALFWEESLVVL